VNKTYRPYEPLQSFLLPPSPLDWLPEGHLARFILELLDEALDLSGIYRHYEREGRGYPPHHPKMMVALLLYGYCVGVPSSRKIARRCEEDIAFRVIAANTKPDYSCVSEFRRIHLEALAGLFIQVLRLCQEAGLVKLGHVALDGTKMKANASKHKAMSYEYMKKKDDELRAKVAELLRAAEATDAEEDATYGKGNRGDELPAELQRAEGRRQRIRELKQKLEAEAKAQKEAAEAAQKEAAEAAQKPDESDDEPPPGGTPLPSHKIPTTADGTPTPKAQRNFTDGDSRIMKTGDGFIQGYNAQAAVDDAHQIIVGQALTNQSPDAEHLLPMIEEVVVNCGRAPDEATADAGYFSERNVLGAIERGVDPHIATGRRKHGEPAPTVRGRAPKDMTLKELMARKLATRRGAKIYSRRKAIVEPVFGQIKNRGFRQFLLRGLAKVRGEWSLITLTHNLLKLHGVLQPL
jgi:transposase